MEDCVPGILPSLVSKTAWRTAQIFDKAVTVEIGVAIDPLEGAVKVRKHVVHQLFVGGPVERLAEKNEPQRRGINGPVIRTERHLPRARHFAFAQLMEDLAWLFVTPVVFLRALIARQHAQRFHRELRAEQQRLICRDARVAPEHGGKPRNSRGNHMLFAFRNLQRVEVALGSPHHLVEDAVAGVEVGGARFPMRVRLTALANLLVEVCTAGAAMLAFYHGDHVHLQLETFERRKLQPPASHGPFYDFRLRRKADYGIARTACAPAIVKHDGSATHEPPKAMPPALTR